MMATLTTTKFTITTLNHRNDGDVNDDDDDDDDGDEESDDDYDDDVAPLK